MTEKPAPYPADTRARGWRFELEYERIENSDTWALAAALAMEGRPLGRPLLLAMWYGAWKQTPCGSLPGDDRLIAAAIGVPASIFAEYRDLLMRGWWLAEDGRLYHPTVADRVLGMLEYRRKNAERVAKFKAAMREQQAGNALPPSESHAKNDTGTGTGTGTNIEERGGTPLKPPARKRARKSDRALTADDLIADGVDAKHAADWLSVRSEKRLPLTATAWESVKTEATKAGLSPADAVKTAAEESWAGFKASWLARLSQPAAAPLVSFHDAKAAAISDRIARQTGGLLGKFAAGSDPLNTIDMEPINGPRLASG